jgi:hypothetical protein
LHFVGEANNLPLIETMEYFERQIDGFSCSYLQAFFILFAAGKTGRAKIAGPVFACAIRINSSILHSLWPLIALEFCYHGYTRNLELIHIHQRINGLCQGNCPAD